MKLSENRQILICSKIRYEDVENYFKAKKIRYSWIDEPNLTVLEVLIDQEIENFKTSSIHEESCLTILLYEDSCRLAFSLQQKTQAQLILINPPVKYVFGNEIPIIESKDDYHVLLAIKNLIETGT